MILCVLRINMDVGEFVKSGDTCGVILSALMFKILRL